MLHMATAEAVFKAWGATSIYTVAECLKNGRTGPFFMILLEDGWHVASEDKSVSVHAGREVFEAANGEIAWFQFELWCSCHRRANAQKELADCIADVDNFHAQLAKSIHQHYTPEGK
jgi:hypothetical protein